MHYDFTTIYDRHNMDALAVDGVGTSWDLMRTGAEHFGLTAKELPLDEGVITREEFETKKRQLLDL